MSKTLLTLVNSKDHTVQRHPMFQGDAWEEHYLSISKGMLAALETQKAKSYDGIWCMHLLATAMPEAMGAILEQCERILKPDGVMLSVVFDAEIAGRHIAQGRIGEPVPSNGPAPLLATEMLYGKKAEYRQCFNAVTIGRYFRNAGFKNVQVTREQLFLWVAATARPSQEAAFSDKIRINDSHRPLGLSDHIGAPPQQWKPLGLIR